MYASQKVNVVGSNFIEVNKLQNAPPDEEVIEDSDFVMPALPQQHDINQNVPAGCIPIDKVHEEFQSVFPYPFFNQAQSQCFGTVYHSDDNMVVSGMATPPIISFCFNAYC